MPKQWVSTNTASGDGYWEEYSPITKDSAMAKLYANAITPLTPDAGTTPRVVGVGGVPQIEFVSGGKTYYMQPALGLGRENGIQMGDNGIEQRIDYSIDPTYWQSYSNYDRWSGNPAGLPVMRADWAGDLLKGSPYVTGGADFAGGGWVSDKPIPRQDWQATKDESFLQSAAGPLGVITPWLGTGGLSVITGGAFGGAGSTLLNNLNSGSIGGVSGAMDAAGGAFTSGGAGAAGGAAAGAGGAFLGDLPLAADAAGSSIYNTAGGNMSFGDWVDAWNADADELANLDGGGGSGTGGGGGGGGVASGSGGYVQPADYAGAFDQYGSIGTPAANGVGGTGYIPKELASYVMATGDYATALSYLPNSVQTALKNSPANAAKGVIDKIMNGDTSAVNDLMKLGLPLALAAGLFEKNTSPLTPTLTRAADSAVASADKFAGMSPVGMMPSSQKAINLANSSAGAWKPYVDRGAALTDQAAAGLPSVNLNDYMNPFLDEVLAKSVRDIEESAARRREQLKGIASKSGNDFRSPVAGGNRFNTEDSLLDRETLRAVGDASANLRKGAFDTATGLASTDLNRKVSAGGAFNTMANTVGTLGAKDFTTLGAAGELEAKPQENALTHAADTAKLYTSVIPGTTSAVTATKTPSVLGQAVGALGVYNAANKAGIIGS